MKLMTYNILDGGDKRLNFVVRVVNNESPDFLTINEANTFEMNNYKKLKSFSTEIRMPYFHLAISGEYDYHVAIFSKSPFLKIEEIRPLMRAGIQVIIKSGLNENISIIGTHLTPYAEDLRLPEIDLIIDRQKKYKHKILMGDLNSLSKYDLYDQNLIKNFKEKQLKKFTTHGKFRFEVTDKIISSGYEDVAFELNKNKENTVPTKSNIDPTHAKLRLDYIFISKSLKDRLRNYQVVKNFLTEKASDHYPIVAEIK